MLFVLIMRWQMKSLVRRRCATRIATMGKACYAKIWTILNHDSNRHEHCAMQAVAVRVTP